MLAFVVFAGCLLKDKNGDGVKELDAVGKATGRLITVQLNVTSDSEVSAAVETVKAKLPPSVKVLRPFFQISYLWERPSTCCFSRIYRPS